MSDDIVAQLEKLLQTYVKNQEEQKKLELQKAELSLKVAYDILEQNRKNTFELITYLSQFINSPNSITPEDNKND